MTKVLISSGDLAKIIEKHPQVELDLMNNVVPQLGEFILKRMTERTTQSRIEKNIDFVISNLRHGTMLPGLRDGLKKIMLEIWSTTLQEQARAEARRIVEEIANRKIADMLDTVRKEIACAKADALEEVESAARRAAEREVLALLRGVKVAAE